MSMLHVSEHGDFQLGVKSHPSSENAGRASARSGLSLPPYTILGLFQLGVQSYPSSIQDFGRMKNSALEVTHHWVDVYSKCLQKWISVEVSFPHLESKYAFIGKLTHKQVNTGKHFTHKYSMQESLRDIYIKDLKYRSVVSLVIFSHHHIKISFFVKPLRLSHHTSRCSTTKQQSQVRSFAGNSPLGPTLPPYSILGGARTRPLTSVI